MPLERRLNYKADRQSLLTAWKSRNTRADPALWSTIPHAMPITIPYSKSAALAWICLNLQQPKPNHSPASCKAPNSTEPQVGATSCLQARAAAAFGDGSWTGVISEVPSSIPLLCPPMHRAPHSHELTISFLTLVRGLTHPHATDSSGLDRVLTGQLLTLPFLDI